MEGVLESRAAPAASGGGGGSSGVISSGRKSSRTSNSPPNPVLSITGRPTIRGRKASLSYFSSSAGPSRQLGTFQNFGAQFQAAGIVQIKDVHGGAADGAETRSAYTFDGEMVGPSIRRG